MKKIYFLFLLLIGGAGLTASTLPDFTVTDVFAKKDNFIYIELQNLSPHNVNHAEITPGMKEKIFLTIFIDNIKRSEYKLKYIDDKLFKKKSTILFRTNFRTQKGLELNVKGHVNPLKIIGETNFFNNTLEKKIHPDKK